MRSSLNLYLSLICFFLDLIVISAFQPLNVHPIPSSRVRSCLFVSTASTTQPTELPDSLVDAAERAAESCASFTEAAGPMARCRVDFDTSAGDETFPILKTSTEFMQNLVRFLSYRLVPGLQEMKQAEVQRVAEARVALQQILQQQEAGGEIDEEAKQKHIATLENNGKDPEQIGKPWHGPVVRVYFPDEGNAALARRDWTTAATDLPPCVQFSSCGGVQIQDVSRDMVVFFFCPKASESDFVEELLRKTESSAPNLLLTVFVNPNLVDMGVTGFGMAGRMLRERLLDGLTGTYYLRTLAWGALTRSWPNAYSIWQEDENSDGGYKLIRTLGYLPSNPEVEDIYDAANGGRGSGDGFSGGGPLDQLGDFVNGMMRL
ncbi:DUF1995 domain containing protein [Nitzschia inconspicua]|uniref:DUF1995 domain containing protein n=1 Tax=Nitzschia inconspicua TaxID=303405 RepID=A0A9K3M060_9STRA|nr:DUF1995 domain containing protein [Nitzschia inconspicua]